MTTRYDISGSEVASYEIEFPDSDAMVIRKRPGGLEVRITADLWYPDGKPVFEEAHQSRLALEAALRMPAILKDRPIQAEALDDLEKLAKESSAAAMRHVAEFVRNALE